MENLDPVQHDFTKSVLPAKLREARIAQGKSMYWLAKQIGLTLNQVKNYEKGVTLPTTGRLEQIAAALGKPLSWFFPSDELEVQPASNRPTKVTKSTDTTDLYTRIRSLPDDQARSILMAQLLQEAFSVPLPSDMDGLRTVLGILSASIEVQRQSFVQAVEDQRREYNDKLDKLTDAITALSSAVLHLQKDGLRPDAVSLEVLKQISSVLADVEGRLPREPISPEDG